MMLCLPEGDRFRDKWKASCSYDDKRADRPRACELLSIFRSMAVALRSRRFPTIDPPAVHVHGLAHLSDCVGYASSPPSWRLFERRIKTPSWHHRKWARATTITGGHVRTIWHGQ
jgi:hypothetical protein